MTYTNQSIVRYVSPDGVQLGLSGGEGAGVHGIWMGHDPEHLGDVDFKAVWDAAARMWGEEYLGVTLDHAEIDIPLFILGDNPDDLRRKYEFLKRTITRDRVGWLMVYTNMQGWRWVGVRKGSLKPAYGVDPAKMSSCRYDLVLLVEQPISRHPDHLDRWQNTNLSGIGSVAVDPGPEFIGWPEFTFRGPGVLTISFAGNSMELPAIHADETALIVTDEARPTIRARNRVTGVKRNLLPLIMGKKFRAPCPKDQVTRVDLRLVGGTADSAVEVRCAQYVEGLL